MWLLTHSGINPLSEKMSSVQIMFISSSPPLVIVSAPSADFQIDACIKLGAIFTVLLHDRIDIKAVSPITAKEYQVGGSTALLDAIGRTIHKIGNVQKNTADDYCAEKVMFVIITDGEENASREYSSDKVKAQIEWQKAKNGWEFIFLGANINAVETAAKFGIEADRAVDYLADSEGTELNFKVMNCAIESVRKGVALEADCFEEIKADVKKRAKRNN